MYELKIYSDRIPESLNKSLRSHHLKRHRINKFWDFYIEIMTKGRKPISPLTKACITIVRHSDRTLDFDGLVGSLKPVVDALVTAKIISDDSWKVTGAWNVDQKFRPKKLEPYLEIIVTGYVDS